MTKTELEDLAAAVLLDSRRDSYVSQTVAQMYENAVTVIEVVQPEIAMKTALFMLNVSKSDLGCWVWTGEINSTGYGRFGIDGWRGLAHRFSYELFVGPIPVVSPPDDIKVLHDCDNPPCVNPKHLWLGTQTDNVKDMDSKGRRVKPYADRTACHNGHPYIDGSWYWSPNGHGRIGRVCRECARLNTQRYRARLKESRQTSPDEGSSK